MTDNNEAHGATENCSSEAQFPAEPFPCPACGQLLGPSCRVCVACKYPINPAEIRQPPVVAAVGQPARQEAEPVRFSWRTFLVMFTIWLVGGTLVQLHMTPLKAQVVLVGVQILCSFWVLFDALRKRLPTPFRWGMGTLLLWPIIFPWYLARRNHPKQPCPFIEARASRAKLAVLCILLAVLLFLMLKQVPPP